MLSDRSSAEPDAVVHVTGRDAGGRLARRVDWRFLLGRPDLPEVLVVGPHDPALADALRVVAGPGAVTVDVAAESSTTSGLVLASPADGAAIARAATRVRPGGWLVLETSGLGSRVRRAKRRAPSADPTRTVRALRAAGFASVVALLAWPDRDRTSALVPLDGDAALSAMLGRRISGRSQPIVRRLGSAARRTGLLASLAPAITILARRPERGGTAITGGSSAGWLADRIAAAGDRGRTGGAAAQILLLTPGFRASAHVVALVLDRDRPTGTPSSVLKVARRADDRGTLGREADALRAVDASLGAAGLAPRVLAADPGGPHPYLLETGVAGTPLDGAAVRADRAAAAQAIAGFVALMPSSAPAANVDLADRLEPALARLGLALSGSDDAELVERTRQSLATQRGATVPTVFEHGDLAHPNLLRTSTGALAAVDWERAEPAGLPLHDLSMGLAYVASAAADARTPAAQAAAFVAALTGPDAWASALVDAELRRLEVAPRLGPVLLLAPWVRTAAWLGERTDVDWLRADRSVALWRAMLTLAETMRPETTRRFDADPVCDE